MEWDDIAMNVRRSEIDTHGRVTGTMPKQALSATNKDDSSTKIVYLFFSVSVTAPACSSPSTLLNNWMPSASNVRPPLRLSDDLHCLE